MKINVYVSIFGNLGSGYTQYPDDYSRDIYTHFYRETIHRSQISIHRSGSLMYYGYIRCLDAGVQYIGVCILLNGVMFTDLHSLFAIFEEAVANMVCSGKIVQVDEHGNLVSKVNALSMRHKEIERVVTFIRSEVDAMVDTAVKVLPPVDYGLSDTAEMAYTLESDDMNDIVAASCKYDYTYVYKEGNCDAEHLLYIRDMIRKLDSEKRSLEEKNVTLNAEYAKLKSQNGKNSYVLVVLLLVALVAIIILMSRG